MAAFEGNLYLFCFGVDDGGNMPRDYSGGPDLAPYIGKLRALNPPQGWLAVANKAKDLANLAETTALTASLINGQFGLDGDYDSANAAWQKDVLPPCAEPQDAIRVIREDADAIP